MNLRFRNFHRPAGPIVILAILVAISQSPVPAAPAVTVGGPFTLKAPDGAVVTDRTFLGKWLLVYFGYTYCPDSCPTALVDIADALRMLGPEAANVQPLFITVDPRRDTPRVLEDYTRSFDARIIGLTGTQLQIDAVAQAYGAYAVPRLTSREGSDYTIDHSVYIYLMDPRGRFVRAFETDWPTAEMAGSVHDAMANYR